MYPLSQIASSGFGASSQLGGRGVDEVKGAEYATPNRPFWHIDYLKLKLLKK